MEHYGYDELALRLARWLQLPLVPCNSLYILLLAAPELNHEDHIGRAAIWAYALMYATNQLRADGVVRSMEYKWDLLQQSAFRAVKGHPRGARLLDGLPARPSKSSRQRSGAAGG